MRDQVTIIVLRTVYTIISKPMRLNIPPNWSVSNMTMDPSALTFASMFVIATLGSYFNS